ncbi:hypothetical protein C7S16_1264 [Burkholderia thailandensis]|uniref:Uncharacterized protein n=1 Tax=Burkholderia thailandensis TaxID=57975 RepID=A0AAW9CVU4_BURTH|nr:hypothetical protein [Burkholderia thailandensis]MDW9254765.1 hypothetical protein [Burkholderia thailandensis]
MRAACSLAYAHRGSGQSIRRISRRKRRVLIQAISWVTGQGIAGDERLENRRQIAN